MSIQRTFSILKPDVTARNLTGKVNFHGAVNGYHFCIAANNMRVVYVINIQECKGWVIVYIPVQMMGA